jgi:molybdenum cofactor guanylyltransferase
LKPVADIARSDITGLVLAGGRGSRMGGLDKGLQPYRGQPLVAHALQRLAPQVGALMINANRHLDAYAAFGVPVVPDALPDFAGPLAGFLAGLSNCATPWLLTVPCDTPAFPLDLVQRLASAVAQQGAAIAMPRTLEDGREQVQPVFCLMRTALKDDLLRFVHDGGRKIDRWTGLNGVAIVPFDRPGDAQAFFNANTLAELQQLEDG